MRKTDTEPSILSLIISGIMGTIIRGALFGWMIMLLMGALFHETGIGAAVGYFPLPFFAGLVISLLLNYAGKD